MLELAPQVWGFSEGNNRGGRALVCVCCLCVVCWSVWFVVIVVIVGCTRFEEVSVRHAGGGSTIDSVYWSVIW